MSKMELRNLFWDRENTFSNTYFHYLFLFDGELSLLVSLLILLWSFHFVLYFSLLSRYSYPMLSSNPLLSIMRLASLIWDPFLLIQFKSHLASQYSEMSINKQFEQNWKDNAHTIVDDQLYQYKLMVNLISLLNSTGACASVFSFIALLHVTKTPLQKT